MKAVAASLFVLGMVVFLVCAMLVSVAGGTFEELFLFTSMLIASSAVGMFGAWMFLETPEGTKSIRHQCQGGLWI